MKSFPASKLVRCYDNGGVQSGGSGDRFTVCFVGRYRHLTGGEFQYLAMNAAPFHPQGFGQHGSSLNQIDLAPGCWAGPSIGRKNHLGTRIRFEDLPPDCRKLVVQDLRELHPRKNITP